VELIYRVQDQWIKDHPIKITQRQPTANEIAEELAKKLSPPDKSLPQKPTTKQPESKIEQLKPFIDRKTEKETSKKLSPTESSSIQQKHQTPSVREADAALRFVYPKSPALMIKNLSDSVVRDIKWMVIL
jgi:hypothetical protein